MYLSSVEKNLVFGNAPSVERNLCNNDTFEDADALALADASARG